MSELGEWQEGRKLGEVDLSLKLCRYFGFLFKGEKEGDEGEQERTERILFTICQLFYLHGQTLKPQTVVKALFTAPIHYRVPNPLPQNAVYSKGGEGGEEVSSYSIMEEEPKGGALPSTDHQQVAFIPGFVPSCLVFFAKLFPFLCFFLFSNLFYLFLSVGRCGHANCLLVGH